MRTKNGREVNASVAGAVATGIASGVIVLISLPMLGSVEGVAIFLTIGGIFGMVQAFTMYSNANDFQRARKRYELKRRSLRSRRD